MNLLYLPACLTLIGVGFLLGRHYNRIAELTARVLDVELGEWDDTPHLFVVAIDGQYVMDQDGAA